MEDDQESPEPAVNCGPVPQAATNPRTLLGRVNTAVYTYNNVKHIYNSINNYRQDRKNSRAYSIAIDSNDRFYFEVQKWLLTQVDPQDQRSIRLMSYDYDDTGDKLYKIFDSATESQTIKIAGHEVVVKLERPLSGKELLKSELIGTGSIANLGNRANIDSPRLVFWTYSSAANEAVIQFFDKLKEEARNTKRTARLHLLAGYWSSHSQELPNRSLESLVLHEGQMERIVADMQSFLRSEKEYARKGIPWHRGYIFHGIPGTGKSSLAKVLASHFGLDLFYYPIGAANSDNEITNTISKVTPKSILLLEDIDVFKGFRKRGTEETKGSTEFTMSGLLNMLDGVMTPHGMIAILTTNHYEALDEAITRPGRVDRTEEIGALEPGQADRIFKVFYEQAPSRPLEVVGFAPAVIMEIMKRNMNTPEIAELEIRALIGKEVSYEKPILILPTDEDEEELECANN